MSTPASNRSTGRAKSCVVCRQFKLACDARKTAPDPCSRCVSKGLKCRFDPNFKRISTRKIAQEVADELHTLRAAQHGDSSSQSPNTPHYQLTIGGQSPAPLNVGRLSVSSHSSFEGLYNDPTQPRWLELAEDEFVNDQSLHGVSVGSSRILKLFFQLSAYHGLPPPIASPQFAKSLKRANQLAKDVLTNEDRAQVKLLDVLCSAQIHLDDIEDWHAHFSLTQTFETQLDAIRIEFQQSWSWNLETQWQWVKFNILGTTLTQELPRDDEQMSKAFLYRQIVLEKCMKAAASYITTMTDLSNQSIAGQRYVSGILTFYPKHYFTSLLAAAAYLFRYLIAFEGATQTQQTLAVTRITEAHKILQSFPDHRDAVRGCVNIETFVNAVRNPSAGGVPASELVYKDRLGASVLKDALFRAAQQRNRDPLDGSSPPVAEWNTMTDDSGHRLPLAPEQKMASSESQLWNNKTTTSMTTHPMDAAMDMPIDMTAMGIWDSYSNDFGVLSEPWLGEDAEFAAISMPQQQVQMMYPAVSGGYNSAAFSGTSFRG
ncbi:Regulatory protein leu3 [Knufia fluminis]|uniref:Regulatory protein leu3 n=1 Tax=Knufia fluminis TaxID=191047 RepID=A0AAN8EMM5_9EURO|nr:Regulatory protein leu3 [Knufia fluminis]